MFSLEPNSSVGSRLIHSHEVSDLGISVIGISDFVPDEDTGIIITVGQQYQAEIEAELKKREIRSYIFGAEYGS